MTGTAERRLWPWYCCPAVLHVQICREPVGATPGSTGASVVTVTLTSTGAADASGRVPTIGNLI